MTSIQHVCEEFNQLTGYLINFSQGPVKVHIAENDFWLELDKSGQSLCIHIRIGTLLTYQADYWLAMNSQVSKLRGAWFAFHQPSNSLRLCWLYPVGQLNGKKLLNCLSHLNTIKKEISSERSIPQEITKVNTTHFIHV